MASDLPYENLGSNSQQTPDPYSEENTFCLPPVLSSTSEGGCSHPVLNNASRQYSTSHGPVHSNSGLVHLSPNSTQSRRTITLGKPLPVFFMSIIHLLLGINLNSIRRTIPGKFFYGLTISFAIGEFYINEFFSHMCALNI